MSVTQLSSSQSSRNASRFARPERIDPAQAYTIAEACAALGISRPQYYKLVAKEIIRPLTNLGAPRIAGAEIIRLTSGAATESQP